MMTEGRVKTIIGPVVEVAFPKGKLPSINGALSVETHGTKVILEVHQHIGDNVVKAVALASTD